MLRAVLVTLALLVPATASAAGEVPLTLRGSMDSMVRQHTIATGQGLPFVRTPTELLALEQAGALIRLEGNDDYELADFVRYPQARPELRLFIERLSAQYRAATEEKLVVTSLTRPTTRQPGNSHELSVHPAGVAVDLRVSQRAQSRRWLEATLLSLEARGLLDVTREYSPPHYHVALFPAAYLAHVDALLEREAPALIEEVADYAVAEPEPVAAAVAPADAVGADARSGRRSTSGWLAALLGLPVVLLVATVRGRPSRRSPM